MDNQIFIYFTRNWQVWKTYFNNTETET